MAEDIDSSIAELEERIEYLHGETIDLDEELGYEYSRPVIDESEIDEEIEALKHFKEANLEVLGDLMVKHREVREMQLALDDLISDYYEHLDRRDLSAELKDEYEDILDERIERLDEISGMLIDDQEDLLEDHIALLEDTSKSVKNGIYARIAGGIATLGAGLALPVLYPEEGFFELYSDLPEIAGESPLLATAVVGLPAVGVYSFKKAYEKQQDYNDLKREIGEYRERRLELEDL